MQLLEGETLRDRLAAASSGTKPLGLDELLDITCQTCGGLEAAHAKSIIHRDIKPANIFLTSTGQAKILDFGVAKLVSEAQEAGSDELRVIPGDGHAGECVRSRKLDTTLTHLGDALGTAGYMSPEQIRGERLDARTDIFSFGLVLYEMATGQRPFNGATAAVVRDAILNETPALARTLSPKLPVKLVSIIGKTLEKDRDRRYRV
jgi:serine/threonine protein kinase